MAIYNAGVCVSVLCVFGKFKGEDRGRVICYFLNVSADSCRERHVEKLGQGIRGDTKNGLSKQERQCVAEVEISNMIQGST